MVNPLGASLEVSRQVESGADTFIHVAQGYAEQIFVDEFSDGVLLPVRRSQAEDDDIYRIRSASNVTVYGKLMLSIVKLGAEADQQSRNYRDFINLAGRLTRLQTEPRTEGVNFGDRLAQIAREFDEDADAGVLYCAGITVTKSPSKKEYELGLTLRDGTRYIREHELFMNAIGAMGRMRPKTVLQHGFTPVIPFASLGPTDSDQRNRYIQTLEKELPLRLTVGPILRPFVR